jgi:hypothetical protein
MRTTVDLPDELLLEVQRIAREQKRTMRSVMEEALRAAIAKYQRAQAFELPDASVDGNGLQPPTAAACDRGRHQHPRLRPPPRLALPRGCRRAHAGNRRGHITVGDPLAVPARVLLDRHPPAHLRSAQHDRAGLRPDRRLARIAVAGPDRRGRHALGHAAHARHRREGGRAARARRADRRALPRARRIRTAVPQPRLQPVPRPEDPQPAGAEERKMIAVRLQQAFPP